MVRFTNASADQLSYNGCAGFIERQTDGRWDVAASASEIPCRNYLFGLQPGESAFATLRLPEALPAAVYRYRFSSVYAPEDTLLPESERVSNPFSVIVRD